MARYIDADKVKTHFDANTWQGEFMIAMCDVTETEDVTPVIHAKWFKSNYDYICTNCGIHSKDYHNYCPNCGAKMRRSD